MASQCWPCAPSITFWFIINYHHSSGILFRLSFAMWVSNDDAVEHSAAYLGEHYCRLIYLLSADALQRESFFAYQASSFHNCYLMQCLIISWEVKEKEAESVREPVKDISGCFSPFTQSCFRISSNHSSEKSKWKRKVFRNWKKTRMNVYSDNMYTYRVFI